MTTNARYDKEILIASHLEHHEQERIAAVTQLVPRTELSQFNNSVRGTHMAPIPPGSVDENQ